MCLLISTVAPNLAPNQLFIAALLLSAVASPLCWLLLLLSTSHSYQVEFLQAYGLAAPDISRLLLACPELFAHCSIYESGRTLLFFKHLGYQVRGYIV
jgi:hypothetical protein